MRFWKYEVTFHASPVGGVFLKLTMASAIGMCVSGWFYSMTWVCVDRSQCYDRECVVWEECVIPYWFRFEIACILGIIIILFSLSLAIVAWSSIRIEGTRRILEREKRRKDRGEVMESLPRLMERMVAGGRRNEGFALLRRVTS